MVFSRSSRRADCRCLPRISFAARGGADAGFGAAGSPVQCVRVRFHGARDGPGVTTLGYRETAELEAAIQALSTRDDVDPKRFGLWGVNLGGYVALEVAASDPRIAGSRRRQSVGRSAQHDSNRSAALGPRRDSLRRPLLRLGIPADELSLPLRSSRFLCTWRRRREFRSCLFSPTTGRSSRTKRSGFLLRAPEPKQLVRDRLSYAEMTDDDRHTYENQIVNFFLQNIPPVSARIPNAARAAPERYRIPTYGSSSEPWNLPSLLDFLESLRSRQHQRWAGVIGRPFRNLALEIKIQPVLATSVANET